MLHSRARRILKWTDLLRAKARGYLASRTAQVNVSHSGMPLESGNGEEKLDRARGSFKDWEKQLLYGIDP